MTDIAGKIISRIESADCQDGFNTANEKADKRIKGLEAEISQFHEHAGQFASIGEMLNAPMRIAELERDSGILRDEKGRLESIVASLTEKLERKSSALTSEIAAKQIAYRDINHLEDEVARLANLYADAADKGGSNGWRACENCAGQKHTDMGTTLCPACQGTGFASDQPPASLGVGSLPEEAYRALMLVYEGVDGIEGIAAYAREYAAYLIRTSGEGDQDQPPTEYDITQAMIQAGRYAANLDDGTLARIYLAMRTVEWEEAGAGASDQPPASSGKPEASPSSNPIPHGKRDGGGA